jgi:hypothetical protein
MQIMRVANPIVNGWLGTKLAAFIGAALLLSVSLCAQQRVVTFGPITLGKPLPVLPECGPLDTEVQIGERGICLERLSSDDFFVYNIIEGSPINAVTSVCDAENRLLCPVVQITAPIGRLESKAALARLTAEFGAPTHRATPFQNGFGAQWIEHDYFWKFASGDLIQFAVHWDIEGDCHLEASTRAFRGSRDEKPKINF